MEKEGYKYTFTEALDKCMWEQYFIRGKQFRPGYYIKPIDDTLYLVCAYLGSTTLDNIMITREVMCQKYKVFSVANKKALEMEKG